MTCAFASTCASPTETLAYDPLGRLAQTVAGGVTRRFLYDGADIIAEYDGAGTPALQERYVHGPWADEPFVWYRGSGTSDRRYLLADERGSIVAEVGASVAKYTYDPFGAPTPATGGGRFRYTGQAWLSEIALHHYKARAYSPRLGRFLQTDPILYDAGPNLYAYVGNDPVNRADPTGLQCADVSCGNAGESGPLGQLSVADQALANRIQLYGTVALSAVALAAVSAPSIIPWFYANAVTTTEIAAAGAGVTGVASRTQVAEEAAKRGVSILGRYPEYLERATELGARRFSIPSTIWSEMSRAEQLAANTKFLDRLIARGDLVVLTTRVGRITGGWLEWEVNYLLSNGYRVANGGWHLVPGN